MEAKSSQAKRKRLESLPGSGNEDFWEGADMHTTYQPKGYAVDECRHHFVSIGGNMIQCRFCHFGGSLKSKRDKITLRNGRSYKVFPD